MSHSICTRNLWNLTRSLHRNPLAPCPDPSVEASLDPTGANLGLRPHCKVVLWKNTSQQTEPGLRTQSRPLNPYHPHPSTFYDLPVLTYQHDPTCSMWHRFFQKLSAILARLQQPVNESCTARRKSSFCRAVRSLDHCDTGKGR